MARLGSAACSSAELGRDNGLSNWEAVVLSGRLAGPFDRMVRTHDVRSSTPEEADPGNRVKSFSGYRVFAVRRSPNTLVPGMQVI